MTVLSDVVLGFPLLVKIKSFLYRIPFVRRLFESVDVFFLKYPVIGIFFKIVSSVFLVFLFFVNVKKLYYLLKRVFVLPINSEEVAKVSKLVEIERFSKKTQLEQFIYLTFCEKRATSRHSLPLNWVAVSREQIIAFVFNQLLEWTLFLKKDFFFEIYIILDNRWIFVGRTQINYQELQELGFSSNDMPSLIEEFFDVTLDTDIYVKFHGFVIRCPHFFNVKPFLWQLSNVK